MADEQQQEKSFLPEAPPAYNDVSGQPPNSAPYAAQPLQQPGYPQQTAYPPQQAYPQQQYNPEAQQQAYPPKQAYPPQQGYPPQQAYPTQQGYPSQPVYNQATANTVVVATQPAGGVHMTNYQAKPDNYLVLSLFSTFCCCWVFGIIALIHSTQVDSAWNSGNYEGARRASLNARKWNRISIIAGIVVTVFAVILAVLGNIPRFLYY